MPVTARLSKRFYDTLGEEIANELVDWFNQVDETYRADLRELNELNFSRFDAKLEQRLAESDARWERRIAESNATWERSIAALRIEMAQDIVIVKADLLKWMFGFWATTALALAALLLRR